MQELFVLLDSFCELLESQTKLFRHLVPILDREEDLLARFDLNDFEKIVIEKDQIAKRASVLEDKRITILRKICYLMSYDARGDQLPTLRTFRVIFENYASKVQSLISAEDYATLKQKQIALNSAEFSFRELYVTTAPRVYRNQQILKKLINNFRMSLSLIQSEVVKSQNYDKSGKSISKPPNAETWSSLRVKV